MTRREFIKSGMLALGSFAAPRGVFGAGTPPPRTASPERAVRDPQVLRPWREGEFQVHFIYTGVAESQFWIMPDGTTMLIDCGDFPAWRRGKLAVWILPDGKRMASEWVARYVRRVNPHGAGVDYLMISHHHYDHAGHKDWGEGTREWKGRKLALSGFLHAADFLDFKFAFDRGWPDFTEPIPNGLCDSQAYPLLRDAFDCLVETRGLKMLKFDVGAANQVAQLRNSRAFPSFSVTNIAGNGKILCRDGSLRDLYAGLHDATWLNENGLSLGVIAQYGKFRLFTAGDFSDSFVRPDGSRCNVEAELAKELDAVDVAKINHHGHHAMPKELVAALRARVWTACIWDQAHITKDTLANLSDRSAYPHPRLIAPGLFSPKRRIEDAGKPFLADIAPEAYDAGHVVVTVAPGGDTYNVSYVTADDESMRVTGSYDFLSAANS